MDYLLVSPSIKQPGYSGCRILLRDGVVVKISSGPDYNRRLIKQAEKQMKFKHSLLLTPRIYHIDMNFGLVEVEMEYINGMSFIEYADVAQADDIIDVIDQLCVFICDEIDMSECLQPPMDVISDKIDSVRVAVERNKYAREYTKLVPELNGLTAIPIGCCHGDLTLSNIIIASDGTIYLIDMLDSYIESPVMDIVKLRQDTQHYWISRGIRDSTKLEVILDEYDSVILGLFSHFEWWRDYAFWQVMNLCRILPYAKSHKDAAFIANAISNTMEQL